MYHDFYAAEIRAHTRIADARRAAQEERLFAEACAARERRQRIRDTFRALIAPPRAGRVRRLLRLAFGSVVALLLALMTTQAAAKPIVYPSACGTNGARMTSSAEYRSIYDPTARGRHTSSSYERYCKDYNHAPPTTAQAFLR